LVLNNISADRETPAHSSIILHVHLDSTAQNEEWNFPAIMGVNSATSKKSSRPGIGQCDCFYEHPYLEHIREFKAIGNVYWTHTTPVYFPIQINKG
jgi:hypothetical protein